MLVQFNVTLTDGCYDFVCHFRNLLSFLALETIVHQPFANEFFRKLFLCFAFFKAFLITFRVEVAAGVRCMDFVHQVNSTVAGKGAGAGMLQNIPLMLEITRAVVDAVKIPVTVKTRLGWDNEHKIIVDLAEQLQDCGIEALTIHGRTRAQMYTGEADWSLIGEVKKNPRMHIPIIGNGDITTPQRAKECFDLYGVDAIMIGRASFGRPWIFKEIKHYIETGKELPALSFEWRLNVLRQEVLDSVNLLDERRGILHVRRHLAASPLFKGIPNFKETRIAMLRAETVKELFSILDYIRGNYGMNC